MNRTAISVALVGLACFAHFACSNAGAVRDRARDRFGVDREIFLKRASDPGLKAALDAWQPAFARATGASVERASLFELIPKFNLLWDQGQLVSGRVSLYARRAETIPPRVTKQWGEIMGADALYAAASLAAEEQFFQGDVFDEAAYSAVAERLPKFSADSSTKVTTPTDQTAAKEGLVHGMQSAIRQALVSKGLNVDGLDIKVSEARAVTLGGVVASEAIRRQAEETVGLMPGVTSVVNNLRTR